MDFKESEFKIYETKDLGKFHLMHGNRPPNPRHIENISKNINEFGMLLQPILVNEKLEVIDGQHRLLAAKKSKSKIYFIIVNGYNIGQVKALNLNQKNWTNEDFLHSYADLGIDAYITLLDFISRHRVFNVNTTLCLFGCLNSLNKSEKSIITGKFKEGTLILGDMKTAEKHAEQLKRLAPYHKIKHRFCRTMINIFKNKNFVFDEFLQKLKLQPTSFVECATAEQYKDLIEKIYNYRRKNKVNLRF